MNDVLLVSSLSSTPVLFIFRVDVKQESQKTRLTIKARHNNT